MRVTVKRDQGLESDQQESILVLITYSYMAAHLGLFYKMGMISA